MPAPRNSNQRNQPMHPGVYRRRRIVLFLVAALCIWGVVSGVNALTAMVSSWFGGTPSASPSQTIAEGQPCGVGDVRVDAMVGNTDGSEAESFASGENPSLWFRLTNLGEVSCTFEAGPAVTFFTIKSGNDLVWDSHDCDRRGLESQMGTLQPGTSIDSKRSIWMTVRSSSTGCGNDQTPVSAGAYTLVATVNGVISDTNQFLIN